MSLSKEIMIGVGLGVVVGSVGTLYFLKKQQRNTVENRSGGTDQTERGSSEGETQLKGKDPVVEYIELERPPSYDDTEVDGPTRHNVSDGVILHAEEDAMKVSEFISNMERECHCLDIKLYSYDEFTNPGEGHFSRSKDVFETCRYLFVFITQNFFENAKLENFLKDILLTESIREEEKSKRVIPVQVEPGVRVHEFEALIPLKYYMYLEKTGDNSFRKVFKNIIINGRQTLLTT